MSGDLDDGPAPVITDPVTGAYSRALLTARARAELSRAARTGAPCSLVLFDVDHFTSVVDAHGRRRGDEVLRMLAHRMKGKIRDYDELFRYGRDQFVVLLPDTRREDAVRLARSVAERIRSREFAGAPPLPISVCAGVATYPDDAHDMASLVACADRRNHVAKAQGRARAVADDVDSVTGAPTARLLDREMALAAVHELLTRLDAARTGTTLVEAVTVHGQPGAGHTRFLDEVARLARLRGYAVVTVPIDPVTAVEPADRVILLADTGTAGDLDTAVQQLTDGRRAPGALGIVRAHTGDAPPPVGVRIELTPWSPGSVKAWLRSTLRAEPSNTLVSYLYGRSGGLPGAVAAELASLQDRSGLIETPDGGWTVTSAVLGWAAPGSRLPRPPTDLVGRETERDQVIALLSADRLVTLTGPGGIGKTRLALTVAAALADGFAGGAVFVPLAGLTRPDQVADAVAAAVGVERVAGRSPSQGLVEQLADTSVLLVLDDVAAVTDPQALVGDLLARTPGVRVLATGAAKLALPGERVYPVPALCLPAAGGLGTGPSAVSRALRDFPALSLFEQRARDVDADFRVTPENLVAVARVCERLDGVPLAIALAAARIDRWSPQLLLTHLGAHLDRIAERDRIAGVGDRPQWPSLAGTVDWSVGQLDPADRALLSTLAAFDGGWTLDAAATVTATPAAGLAGRLAALATRNLIVAGADDDGRPCYAMSQTVRAYAVAGCGVHIPTGEPGAATAVQQAKAVQQAGVAAALGGHDDEARRLLTDALARCHELGEQEETAISLETVARFVASVNAVLAAQLLGAADGLRDRYRLPAPPDMAQTRSEAVLAAEAALGEPAYRRACAAGREAPLELIVERAREAADTRR
jgi:diguanylate cyclase (GGDEF)-like protein